MPQYQVTLRNAAHELHTVNLTAISNADAEMRAEVLSNYESLRGFIAQKGPWLARTDRTIRID